MPAITDYFDRAELGEEWIAFGGEFPYEVGGILASSAYYCTDTFLGCRALITEAEVLGDFDLSVKLEFGELPFGNSTVGLFFRANGSGTGYEAQVTLGGFGQTYSLRRMTEFGAVSISSGSVSTPMLHEVTHVLRVLGVGNDYVFYIDDEMIGEFSDDTCFGPYVGLSLKRNDGLSDDGMLLDEFSVTYSEPEPESSAGGTLSPTVWANKWALDALTM